MMDLHAPYTIQGMGMELSKVPNIVIIIYHETNLYRVVKA